MTTKNIHGRINRRGNMERKNVAFGLLSPKEGLFYWSFKVNSDFAPIHEGITLYGTQYKGAFKKL